MTSKKYILTVSEESYLNRGLENLVIWVNEDGKGFENKYEEF